ncbi:endophilin-B1-like isoform X2 [Neolamprologus brichardi]|uniref:endophilin-B1-like isoform X2 n=1 Tax=Neolamprologus brichardi TaxID=32507 RepID=UPI0003EC5621|nr:endophilin-B1-like isoform X2 [Neolamprologus brichardi]
MDLTRLAVDAGQFINRAVQYTGESLGQAERTELDPGLEELLSRAEATKTWTDQIISQTEALLQPSLGTALIRCGEAQKQLGEAERKFVQSTNIHFLTPLRSFTEGEYKAIQNERKMLVNKRLDFDITKARLRKAHEAKQEARNLNANPLEDDYLSHVSYMFSFLRVKWLKIWAQEISQAEMELRICQSLYNRQSEITRAVVEGLSNTHTNHMRSLTDFVDAQASYFAQCNQHAQELQKQLASIPAVFCSNNWQSAISNPVSQPSTSNHEANEPISANHVTPLPVLVHQLPDFDQDSWTLNSPPQTVKTTADSSFSALLTHQTNNNNNNNIISTTRQTPSNHSPIYSQSTTVQAIDRVSTPNQTDQLQTPGRMARMSDASPASTQVLTFNTTASISNGAATAASPPLQPSATCSINEGDVQESSSGHQDVGQ